MKRLLMTMVLLLMGVRAGNAQTIWPVVAEFQARTDANAVSNGQVTLRNDGLFPMLTSVEAVSFSVSDVDHKQTLRPLDDNVQIQWETTSAKIPAKQEFTFYYKATCKLAPCWAMIFATMTGPKPVNVSLDPNSAANAGVVISLRLPSMLLVYGHIPPKKENVKLVWHGSDCELQNTSSQLVRASGAEAHMADGSVKKLPVFSVFPTGVPGSSYRFHFDERPSFVVVHFRRFTVDSRDM